MILIHNIHVPQKMEFCKKCDNMYYLKVDDKHKLVNYCKYCGFEDNEGIETKNLKVLQYSKEETNNGTHVNEYTKYDPTLPHMNTIKCPNQLCPSNQNKDIQQDVIYIRYDDRNMK